MRCGRCTIGFDHHCKWINNCIGVKNYAKFIILILSVEVYHIYLVSHYAFILNFLFQDHNQKGSNLSNEENNIFYASATFVIISVSFCALIICLIGYLIAFHIYITVKGITTYQYFVKRSSKIDTEKFQNINSDANLNNKDDKEFLKGRDSALDRTEVFRDVKIMGYG